MINFCEYPDYNGLELRISKPGIINQINYVYQVLQVFSAHFAQNSYFSVFNEEAAVPKNFYYVWNMSFSQVHLITGTKDSEEINNSCSLLPERRYNISAKAKSVWQLMIVPRMLQLRYLCDKHVNISTKILKTFKKIKNSLI